MTFLPQVRKFVSRHFDEEFRFFKGWMAGPREVGSIVPTGRVCARSMAASTNPASSLPVLEIGPGTGTITRAILERGVAPQNLYSVEYSEDFVEHMRVEFPQVNVIHGDAFDLDMALGAHRHMMFDTVISGVPMLNFPKEQRVALVEDFLDRMPPGRPVVQITYGPLSPVRSGDGNFTVTHSDFVLRNVPPANVWIYRRGD